MRVDSSGNVGIGTSSPAEKLHVVGKIAVSGTNPSIRQTVQTANLDLCGGTTIGTDPSIQICGSSNATDANFVFYNSNSHVFRNSAGSTERARINSDGALLVGATSVSSVGGVTLYSHQKQATVNGDTFSDQQASNMAFNTASGSNDSGASTCYLARYNTAGASTPGAFFKGYQDTTIVIKINNNGNITNTNNSYGSLSDVKLKENIVDAKSQWDDIKSLRVRNYNFKEETGYQTNRQIGLVAQEVEIVSPGLVIDFPENNDEVTKTINYSVLYMKAVKALQEAMERIETLETKVAALEAN
jgi:hypothetical protein